MMFAELSLLLHHLQPSATSDEYVAAIIEQNILAKRTQATRGRTAQRLIELYSLDGSRSVFRLLRHFWDADRIGQPMLAFIAACARDPLLRSVTPFVISIPGATPVMSTDVAEYLGHEYPGRFGKSTLRSTAQNVASSWTQAGYLAGKTRKHRRHPVVTPVVVTYAFALGYLSGSRGKSLLETIWVRMLDSSNSEVASLAAEASKQGWMTYKSAGAVVEVTFPGLFTAQEERISRESD